MRKVKVAQIGTSMHSHGLNVFENLRKQSDVFDVVGYVFPENEREKFPNHMAVFEGARELTLDEVLNNPEIEAVTIETEEIYLPKYAIMAAKAGKHIHMEKPGGIRLSDFENLIGVVKETGKVFHMGYMYRYNPCVCELMKKIKAGELGEIISVEAQMNSKNQECAREWINIFPGGMMFFLGCHMIDLILQIKGMPDNVVAYNRRTELNGIMSEDCAMAVLEYKNGVSFARSCAIEMGGFGRRQLVVTGTKGTIEIKPLEMFADGGLYTTMTECVLPDWNDKGVTVKSDVYDRYDAMMSSFAAMVRGEKENPWSYDYELELYKTILKACGNEIK